MSIGDHHIYDCRHMSDKFSIAHNLLQRNRAVTRTVAKVSDGVTIQIITPDGTDLIRQLLRSR